MNARNRSIGFGTAVLALSTAASAQLPVGTRFTYQGQLQDAGIPAGGTFDFTFRLFDAATLGAQLGGVDAVENLAVADGLFTVALNDSNEFGAAAFTGDARFLEIAVRPGASGGAYTTLAPRQPITAAPYALYALNGGNWEAEGNAITNTNGGFVGVNRTARVSSAEHFGIQAPTGAGSYGGMYIRTDSDGALPFYGYKCGPAGQTAWTYLDGATGKWHVHNDGDRVTVEDNGDVGIGTTDPTARLHVLDDSNTDALNVRNNGSGLAAQFFKPNGSTGNAMYAVNYGSGLAAAFESHDANTTPVVSMWKNGRPVLRLSSTYSAPGTPATDAPLAIVGGSDSSLAGGGFAVLGGVDSANLSIDNNEIMARNNGASAALYLNHAGGDVNIAMQGTARCRVLEITGADVAERFPSSEAMLPGMVAAIDPSNPGKLCLARGAYNRAVAGVVSGAGNLPVGAVLGNLPASEDGPPIALSGRVWVQCDATAAAITAGDLLTTSDAPGHAMKVSDLPRAQGAVIGKAMTELPAGQRGLVLVLVNLQ